jgi:hypothetical protein
MCRHQEWQHHLDIYNSLSKDDGNLKYHSRRPRKQVVTWPVADFVTVDIKMFPQG